MYLIEKEGLTHSPKTEPTGPKTAAKALIDMGMDYEQENKR